METQLIYHLEKQSNKIQNIKHVNFVHETSKESFSGHNQSCTKKHFYFRVNGCHQKTFR